MTDTQTNSTKIYLQDAAIILEKEEYAVSRPAISNDKDSIIESRKVCPKSCPDTSSKISLTELHHIMRGCSSFQLSEECSPVLFDTPSEPRPSIQQSSSITSASGSDLYYCPPGMHTLKECLTLIRNVATIMGLILEVSPVTEVKKRKTGPMKGKSIPSSSVIVADPTHSSFNITMWWDCAVWAERLSPGDIVILSGISLKEYGSDIMGNTTHSSTIINLHQPKNVPTKLSGRVPEESLASFISWAKREHHCIYNEDRLPKSQRAVCFATSDSIKSSDSIVHFRGVVSSFISHDVVLIADNPLKEFLLMLVGGKSDHWKKCLQEGVGLVWEMRYLQVLPEGTQTGSVCLQLTSRSSFNCLKQDCPLSKNILQHWSNSSDIMKVCTSVRDIQPTNTSWGRYQLSCVHVTSISIIGCNVSLDHENMSTDVLVASFVPQLVYSGCGQCTSELPRRSAVACSRCGSKERGYFYRSLMINLTDEKNSLNCVCVLAHHSSVTTMFGKGVPTQLSHDPPVDQAIKHVSGQLSAVFSGCGSWIVGVSVTKDENSFVKSFDCYLQEWNNRDMQTAQAVRLINIH